MRKNLLKVYAFLLLVGAFYHLVLLGFKYEDIYSSWHAFFSPQIGASAYAVLAGFYVLAIGTPVVMTIVGVLLLKVGYIKWYLAIVFVVILLLSALVGKLILLASICVYLYLRVTRNHLTNCIT